MKKAHADPGPAKKVRRDDGIEELSKVVNKIKIGENSDEEVEAPVAVHKQ